MPARTSSGRAGAWTSRSRSRSRRARHAGLAVDVVADAGAAGERTARVGEEPSRAPRTRAARTPPSAPAERVEALHIVNPPPGAIYLYDPTLRAAFQTLPLRAVTAAAGSRLAWEVDGRAVGASDSDRPLEWPLARGPHTVVVSDGRERDETSIVV